MPFDAAVVEEIAGAFAGHDFLEGAREAAFFRDVAGEVDDGAASRGAQFPDVVQTIGMRLTDENLARIARHWGSEGTQRLPAADPIDTFRALVFSYRPEEAMTAFDRAESLLEAAGKPDQAAMVKGWRDMPGTLIEVKPGTFVHSRATVHPEAVLGTDVVIGPKALISGGAKLGDGVTVDKLALVWDHAIIGSGTNIGADAIVMPSAIVGQDATLGAESIVYENAMVGPRVNLGPGGKIAPKAHVWADVTIGADAVVGPGAMIAPGANVEEGAFVPDGVKVAPNTIFYKA